MYYLFVNITNDKRRKSLEAQMKDRHTCEKLIAHKDSQVGEENLEFFVDTYAINMDYIPISGLNGAILASSQLCDLFSQQGVHNPSYPTILRDEKTEKTLSTTYRFLVLEQEKLEDIIDWERSEFWIDQKIGQRFISTLAFNTQFEARFFFQPGQLCC